MVTRERCDKLWELTENQPDRHVKFLTLVLRDIGDDNCMACDTGSPVIVRNETYYHKVGVNFATCSAARFRRNAELLGA